MRAKIHLLDCDDPLDGFSMLRVRCGQVLAHAVHAFSYNLELLEQREPEALRDLSVLEDDIAVSRLGVWCLNCRRMKPQGQDRRRYVYGLAEGEVMKQVVGEAQEF